MKKQIFLFFFVLLGFFVFFAHPLPSYAQLNMLIYGDTDPGVADTAPGFNVTVWNDATWAAASTADFKAFNVIVFADAPLPYCLTSPSVWNAAVATEAAWGPAITGNVLIIGSDPDFHINAPIDEVNPYVEYNFLNYAASGTGTGLYVALSCVYNSATSGTTVPLLSPLGTFTVEGDAAGGYDDAHIVAASPAFTGVTDAMLSNWFFSVHEGFDVWPSNFVPLAIATDATNKNYTASDGTSGLVYILASGDIVALGTHTPTPYPTLSPTPNYTLTLTPFMTPTPTLSPTITPTPTATLPTTDVFYVSANAYNSTKDNPVSICVQCSQFPGEYNLWIYNTAGEHIKTLDHQELSAPISQSYTWDGTNKYNDKCASGVYILYLQEPFSQRMKRIALIR
jgi:hypothetical protein